MSKASKIIVTIVIIVAFIAIFGIIVGVRGAYRAQSMRWHPDRNPRMDTTAMMRDINEAYAAL